MAKTKLLIIILILISKTFALTVNSAFTLGPTLHWNFGGNQKGNWNIGMEIAYWQNTVLKIPLSINAGFEYNSLLQWLVFSELQTGVVFFGASSGIIIQLPENEDIKFGYQVSAWANCFVGVDIRYRYIRNHSYLCPGIYAKLPIPISGNYSGF